MGEIQKSTFIITREGRVEKPQTVIREGLRIGRLEGSDLWLNHPAVARFHAGISESEGFFHLINLSVSSPTALNGRPIPYNEVEALTAGDEIQIGPFFLYIDEADEDSETLRIRVARYYALAVGDLEARRAADDDRKQEATEEVAGSSGSSRAANAVKIFWDDKRTRERAGDQSPLDPKTPPRLGMERFNWTPSSDLVRPWPRAVFTWAVVMVGALSAAAAIGYKTGFAPRPVSAPHERNNFTSTHAVAKRPSGGSCTSCHTVSVSLANRGKMNANCAACHQTEAFFANVTRAHREAGITCTHCHAEHGGGDFRPMKAGLDACAKCHTDENKNLYNGKSVHTSHGGTYGYPVANGVWVWKGLDEEELAEKPEMVALLEHNRVTPAQAQRWRNVQFHGLHVNRVRIVAGVTGVADADGVVVGEMLSCSSCHKSRYMAADVDRTFPRTTCGQCHNTRVFDRSPTSTTEAETPSCSSCHVQHVKDLNRDSSLVNARLTVPTLAVEK